MVNISRNQKRRPLQRVLITVMCIVIVLLSIPVYGAVRKPFGYVANATESTNDVWEVRTRIHLCDKEKCHRDVSCKRVFRFVEEKQREQILDEFDYTKDITLVSLQD